MFLKVGPPLRPNAPQTTRRRASLRPTFRNSRKQLNENFLNENFHTKWGQMK